MQVKFGKLHPDAKLPSYAHDTDVGLDLTALTVTTDEGNEQILTCGFGINVEIPVGYVGLLFARSSIKKVPLDLANAVGVIDPGFEGELKANFRKTSLPGQWSLKPLFKEGDRVAQLVIVPAPKIEVIEVESKDITGSARGKGGFGSTGQ